MTINQQNDVSQRQNFYCKLYINDIELIPQNIVSCVVRTWIFDILPRLELIILDDGVLTEIAPITDSTIIRISFSKNGDTSDIIDAEFIKQDHTVDNINNKISHISLTGIYKTSKTFYPLYNRSFHNKSSQNVLQTITREMGLTFVNVDNIKTTDNMNWLQINMCNYNMLKHVLDRAYKPNDAIFGYVDINNTFNITSLNSGLNKSDIKYAKYDINKYSATILDNKDIDTLWYNSYDIKNIEGYANNQFANGVMFSYFDYDERSIKNNKLLFNDTTVDNNIRSNNDPTINVNYGSLFTKIQQRNVFNKYYESQLLNKYKKWAFFNQSVLLNINSITDVNLFDKILLSIPSKIDNNINEVYSGEYIVGGIVYILSKNDIFRKQVSLHRVGTNKSDIGK
jgi:hypothetical protein